MNWISIVLIVYAVFLLGGGVMGYVSAGSMVSLIASSVAAVIVLVGVALSTRHESLGYGFAFAVACAMAGFFISRIMGGGKLMPALPAALMSLAVVVCLIIAHLQKR
jgi:uncharacterized membrane protein (UPF0136 family)